MFLNLSRKEADFACQFTPQQPLLFVHDKRNNKLRNKKQYSVYIWLQIAAYKVFSSFHAAYNQGRLTLFFSLSYRKVQMTFSLSLAILWPSVTILINSMEFIKILFLKVIQWCKPICAARTLWDVVLKAMNSCEPQRKLCDMTTLRLTHDLWCKTFRRTNAHRSFVMKATLCRSSTNARFEQGTLCK